MSDLNELREKIDGLDGELLRLLNERASIALEVGRVKSRDGLPIYAPAREASLLRSLCERSSGPLGDKAIRAIYREIISASLALEKDVVIACHGHESSVTHQAARARFGSSVSYTFFPEISELFEAVERGEGDCGVVPIDSVVGGVDGRTLDALTDTSLVICGEVILASDSSPDKRARFFILARTATPITGRDRTTLLLRVEDRPGALVDALEPFKDAELNLRHFASRPASKGSNDTFFFVEVEGHSRDEAFGDVLRGLSRNCRAVKVLGSYPTAE
jgi:chorismate mutase-like protein